MLGRAKFASVAFALTAVIVIATGGASAWGASTKIHAGRISGVVHPLGRLSKGVAAAGTPAPLAASGSLGAAKSPGGGSPPLLYAGGPVMHAVTTHVITWAPTGQTFPAGYVTGFETFLGDLQHDLGLSTNISSIVPQYLDASGTSLSSLTNDAVIPDPNAYPTTGNCTVSGVTFCLTETQLLNEVASVISSNGLPVNIDQSYIVLLPPGVDTCTDTTSSVCEAQYFCGYHDTFGIGNAETTFTLLPYTRSSYSNSGGGGCYDPTVSYPTGQPDYLMALDSIGAHELFESATDPVVEPTANGYFDSVGKEIGDECAWTYGSLTHWSGGGTYNQLLNGHPYVLQEMWSNQDNACVQGDSSTPTATITPGANPDTSSPTSFSAALSGASATGATYAWSYLDPNGNLNQNVSTSATPQLSLSTAGTYTVWVQVTVAAGGTITGVTTVAVAAPPAASFSYTTQGTVPATNSPVDFNSGSTAYGGQAITATSWTFGDGSSSTASSPAHTYSAPGTYTVTLTVTQTDNQTSQTSQSVTVDNPPTAAFTAGSSPTAGTPVSFSSSGSSAGKGSITHYAWTFGDGATSTASNPSHTYSTGGDYAVALTITQTDGLTATIQHTVAVTTPPPTAAFGFTTGTTVPATGSPVSFTSTSTAFSHESITASAWDFGDGSTGSGTSISHTYTAPGTYTVTLTVTQTTGETAQTTHSVTVDVPPTAAFTAGSNPTAGTGLAFSSSGTSAGTGSISSYSWSFGDGGTSGAANPSHTYSSAGSFTVTLTVTQSDGLTATVQHTVSVAAPAATGSSGSGSPPPASASPSSASLIRALIPPHAASKIPTLLRRGGVTVVVSSPNAPGRITITWYATVRHHRIVVARGSATVQSGVAAHVVIRLTAAGRILLRRSRTLRITVSGVYVSGSSSVTVTRTMTLRR